MRMISATGRAVCETCDFFATIGRSVGSISTRVPAMRGLIHGEEEESTGIKVNGPKEKACLSRKEEDCEEDRSPQSSKEEVREAGKPHDIRKING